MRIAGTPALLALLAGACTPGAPAIDGQPGAPPDPATLWPVPPAVRAAPGRAGPPASSASAALAADSAALASVHQLSLPDVIGLSLRSNPATRVSWAGALAAADAYGAARGILFPSLQGSVSGSRSGYGAGAIAFGAATGIGAGAAGSGGTAGDSTRAGGGSPAGLAGTTRTQLVSTLTLSYLLLDLGGRSGGIEAARQRAIAADLAHNGTVRDVVLQTESTLFSFLADRALRDAQRTSLQEAEADSAAAAERYRIGVGTIQDVLQTRTAVSQARFQLESLQGSVASARGALAVAMGLRADARFEIPAVTAPDTVPAIALPLDTLIQRALADRPEVAELRAQAAALAAELRVARSAGYPALTLTADGSYVNASGSSPGHSYTVLLGLQIPIFNGLARRYDLEAARADYAAALAQVASREQQVSLQVLTSYAALQAATQRVRTGADLLASATRSADVAAGRYRAGVGTIVDVLLARSALAAARAEAIQARWEWRTSLAQLAHDAGSLDLRGAPGLPLGSGPEPPR